jgi:hypothetical protein
VDAVRRAGGLRGHGDGNAARERQAFDLTHYETLPYHVS